MIATPVEALPKGMLPKPELYVSNTLVAQALDHLQALRKIYAQQRANELEKIKRGLVVVVKVRPCVSAYIHGKSKYDDLMK